MCHSGVHCVFRRMQNAAQGSNSAFLGLFFWYKGGSMRYESKHFGRKEKQYEGQQMSEALEKAGHQRSDLDEQADPRVANSRAVSAASGPGKGQNAMRPEGAQAIGPSGGALKDRKSSTPSGRLLLRFWYPGWRPWANSHLRFQRKSTTISGWARTLGPQGCPLTGGSALHIIEEGLEDQGDLSNVSSIAASAQEGE